tara:strand:- start:1040 stop:1306 length:267 start_codon:yes stop_codon:yes gene_type:complete
MERNGSIVLDDQSLAYAKHQLETTDISKYCSLDGNVLTIHDHEGYTDALNKYWHSKLNIEWTVYENKWHVRSMVNLTDYILGVSNEVH